MKLRVEHNSGMHKLQVPTVTLTFDQATWFLHAKYRLVVMIICAKQYLNPTMHDEVMMKLWVRHDSRRQKPLVPTVTLTFDLATSFLYATNRRDDHFCQIIVKSDHA